MKQTTRRQKKQDDGYDFKLIKQRFFALNDARLRRVKDDMRPSQRDFVLLLPLLFHVNHPILPGYVSKTTPVGIPEYNPGAEVLAAARRLSKSFSWKKRAYRKFDIHGIYLMGSTGTIAYSDKSDYDIWVCHGSELSAVQINELQDKARAIEHWADAMDVEANVFLVDAERFKQGEHGKLTSESSGSALHYLLLEEFYRTSVLLAGRYPLWWLVPPEEEANYDEFVDDVKRKRFIHSREHIDFGGLSNIKAEEFYGATLWLLYKGINSPYKSILKILLMEAYACEYPQIDLLGVRFKKKVYEGEEDINALDPYLMMMHKVEEYLLLYNQDKRLELARRSFYFKVNEHLSDNKGNKKNNWRQKLMAELVGKWRWTSAKINKLDMREEWKINSVLDERRSLVHEFTGSYRFLSLFARSRSETSNLIDPADLNVLGRKLYAAFERKAGKIDIVYKGITPDLHETHLSFHQLQSNEEQEYWMVFSGVVGEDEAVSATPLKRSYSLLELVAWCYFNKIVNKDTVIALYVQDTDLTEKELHQLIEQLSRLFPDDVFERNSIHELRQPARVEAVGTFINIGLDPFSAQTRQGKHLSSNRTDALKYGGRKENLTLSIDQVMVTSWKEVLTFKYFEVEGLMKCIHDYLKWTAPSSGQRPPQINAFSFSSYRGTSIARRIEDLFTEIISCFYSGAHPEGTQYILGVEWEYYVLRMENERLQYEKAGAVDELYKYLSRPLNQFRQVIFDPQTLTNSILPLIYKHNRQGDVQCFYEVSGEDVDIYVIDEKGSLYMQSLPFYETLGLVRQFREYFDAVKERMSYLALDRQIFNEVIFYRIDRVSDGKRKIKPHTENKYFQPSSFISLQVLVDKIEDKILFTIFCEDREFSTLEHGNNVYRAAAEYILSLRGSGDSYPIYITDLDLSNTLLESGSGSMQTVYYLNYKKIIEEKLWQVLNKIN